SFSLRASSGKYFSSRIRPFSSRMPPCPFPAGAARGGAAAPGTGSTLYGLAQQRPQGRYFPHVVAAVVVGPYEGLAHGAPGGPLHGNAVALLLAGQPDDLLPDRLEPGRHL